MQEIKKLYRANYTGEEVISSMTYEGGTWNFEREEVPNMVTNTHVSNNAVVIGNGVSRKQFDLNLIKNHKGGLLGSKALQTYGCNALYRDFTPNFLVANGDEIVKELATNTYTENNIVYTNANAILDYPGRFYLIPQDPGWNAGTIAAYMACFDGHKKVYLLGFDGIDNTESGYNIYAGTRGYSVPSYGYNDEFWVKSMSHLFSVYDDVDFVRVSPTGTWQLPEAWKYAVNLRQIDFRQFTIEADL